MCPKRSADEVIRTDAVVNALGAWEGEKVLMCRRDVRFYRNLSGHM